MRAWAMSASGWLSSESSLAASCLDGGLAGEASAPLELDWEGEADALPAACECLSRSCTAAINLGECMYQQGCMLERVHISGPCQVVICRCSSMS